MSATSSCFELGLSDPLYPSCVKELKDPPETLYVRGDPTVLSKPSLSIVGSRNATPYGLEVARCAGLLAAESGIIEVSGGARGVDQAGAWGAVDAGGVHVMVVGTGADVIYPASSRRLVERTLADGGAVVSPFPWGMQPLRWAFPKRNRVIAALSEALFVTEASMPSGTFSTAEAAMELGRELLVAPGSILSPESRGSNYLISNGATCIVDEESIEVAISRIYGRLRRERVQGAKKSGLNAKEQRAISALVAAPMRADDLASHMGMNAIECLRFLGQMELKGLAERLVDGRYAPTRAYLGGLAGFGSQ